MLTIGSLIDGKYKILSLIGCGGMSNVYLAINEKVNKTWAIKEVRKHNEKDYDVIKQSLVVEMELLKKIHHQNLPRIIDVIDEEDNLLIVMDYIEGITLETLLEQKKVLEQSEVVKWSMQLCDVLDYLHHQTPPIIYRDMKPSNIMINSDGNVVLIDFGTAREYNQEKQEDTTCLGTRGYAAPEQFGGMGQTDERTDIFNLGATMYHLITGHNPACPPYEMYPIRHWNEGLSSGLEYIIKKSTNQNPKERYQSASELKFALQNYRKLDESAILKYRKFLCIFFGFLIASFFCLFTSCFMWNYTMHEKSKEYSYTMRQAEKMTNEDEKLQKYIQAIEINPIEQEAYQKIYELIIEDGVMTDKEEKIILGLNTSTKLVLENFEKKNPKGYADFCYSCGNAYWYYYIHKEARQTHAVNWFKTAAEYYENDEKKQIEYRRSRLYLQIGSFYRKILAAQIDGSDAGMYGEYWNSLMELKEMNDQLKDRDHITLYLYEEIVAKSMEYARYLKEDGITKDQITKVYEEIADDLQAKKKTANKHLIDEICYVVFLLDGADSVLNSNF